MTDDTRHNEGHWIGSFLRSLLRCWPILVVPILLTAIATGTEQGRDAIAATATQLVEVGPGLHAYLAHSLSTVLATLAAVILLGPRGCRLTPHNYYAYFVPALIGLLAGYAPLLALEWFGFGGIINNAWLGLSCAMVPIAVLAARDGIPLIAQALGFNGATKEPSDASETKPSLAKRLQKRLRSAAKRFRSAGPYLLSAFYPRRRIYALVILALFVSAFFIPSVTVLALMALAIFLIGDRLLYPAEPPTNSRCQNWALILAAAFAVVGGFLVAYNPTYWGLAIGSYATLIVALDTWLGIGILAWQWRFICTAFRLCGRSGRRDQPGGRLAAGPTLGAALVVALIVLALTGPFGLSDIRVLPKKGGPHPASGLGTYAQAWLDDRANDIKKAPDRYPIFLISADGGGVRAAWWSATLLGLIADQAPAFPRHIFAMSGASGGSLGIATFALQQAQIVDRSDAECSHRSLVGSRQSCAADLLGADLLAPTLAAMLIADLGRSVIKHKIWNNTIPISLPPDRATALERALEQVWKVHTGTQLFEVPFTALWEGKRRLAVPLLLLNTSNAVTGRRLVITPVKVAENTHERGDLLPLLGTDGLRVSTAVVLSARFPGVSPAGWIKSDTGELGYAIADGGYADNSGVRSATEALAALRKAAEERGLANKIRVVALMIANAPLGEKPEGDVPAPGKRSGVSTLGSLIGPVMTLDRLRQTNTEEAKRAYAAAVGAAGGLVLDQFDLRAGTTAFPLGWMLSTSTRDAMKAQQKNMLSNSASHLWSAIRLANEAARSTETAPPNMAK